MDREEFKKVFLKGRNKLRKLKMKLVIRFALKNPFAAIRMMLKEPGYYLPMLTKWMFKQ